MAGLSASGLKTQIKSYTEFLEMCPLMQIENNN